MINRFLFTINGREIFSLSTFKVDVVFPEEISIINNLPLLVDR